MTNEKLKKANDLKAKIDSIKNYDKTFADFYDKFIGDKDFDALRQKIDKIKQNADAKIDSEIKLLKEKLEKDFSEI